MLRGLLGARWPAPDMLSGEVLIADYVKPPVLAGPARKQSDALVKKFKTWFRTYSSGGADCQHVSTVVGQALEQAGHHVVIIGGDARGSDAEESGTHYWLEVNGKFYDPKQALLRLDDKSFRYSRHIGAWRWTVDEALDNAVEACPVLR